MQACAHAHTVKNSRERRETNVGGRKWMRRNLYDWLKDNKHIWLCFHDSKFLNNRPKSRIL